jgi:hypothetical protein
MLNLFASDPIWELIARFAIDTLAMTLLIFGMYIGPFKATQIAAE